MLDDVALWKLDTYKAAAELALNERGVSAHDLVSVPGPFGSQNVQRWMIEASEMARLASRLRALDRAGLLQGVPA